MSKHTQWEVGEYPPGAGVRSVAVLQDGRPIAYMTDSVLISGTVKPIPRRLQFANAHLFKAAPDLLEAAEDFVAKVDRGDARSTDSYAKFSAAIAKATA